MGYDSIVELEEQSHVCGTVKFASIALCARAALSTMHPAASGGEAATAKIRVDRDRCTYCII